MKDPLEHIFEDLKDQLDMKEPPIGHFERFEARLSGAKKDHYGFKKYRFIAVAASVLIIFGFWLGSNFSNPGIELSQVSPEMEETQTYFVTIIENELEKIETLRTEDNNQLINDALDQLKILDSEYKSLTIDLEENNDNKRVIYAMISNFQHRITVLQNLLIQLENLKQMKNSNHETYI